MDGVILKQEIYPIHRGQLSLPFSSQFMLVSPETYHDVLYLNNKQTKKHCACVCRSQKRVTGYSGIEIIDSCGPPCGFGN